MLSCLSLAVLVAVSPMQDVENTVPEEVRAEMQFLVGNWTVKAEENGEANTATYSAQWTAGGHCLFLTYNSDQGSGVAIAGWDPTSREIVETWYSPTLGRLTQRFKLRVTKDVWEGTSRLHDPDGTVKEGTIRLEKVGDDTFKFKRTSGDESFETINHRVKPEPTPQNSEHLEAMGFFVGEWRAEMPNGDVVEWEFEWGRNHNFIENEVVSVAPDGSLNFSNDGFIMWDRGNRRLVNSCVNAAGNRVEFLWEQQSEKLFHTWMRGSDNTMIVKLVDDNTFELEVGGTVGIYKRRPASEED